MRLEIICGKKGCGKTTYIKKIFPYEKYVHANQFADSSCINQLIFANVSTVSYKKGIWFTSKNISYEKRIQKNILCARNVKQH